MVTNRRTRGRPPRRRITPEAIAIFRRMLELEENCSCQPPSDDDEKYFKHEQCPACDQWWECNAALARELKLFPWEWPAYEKPNRADDDDEPADAVAANAIAPNAIARYHALVAASEAAKAKRR